MKVKAQHSTSSVLCVCVCVCFVCMCVLCMYVCLCCMWVISQGCFVRLIRPRYARMYSWELLVGS